MSAQPIVPEQNNIDDFVDSSLGFTKAWMRIVFYIIYILYISIVTIPLLDFAYFLRTGKFATTLDYYLVLLFATVVVIGIIFLIYYLIPSEQIRLKEYIVDTFSLRGIIQNLVIWSTILYVAYIILDLIFGISALFVYQNFLLDYYQIFDYFLTIIILLNIAFFLYYVNKIYTNYKSKRQVEPIFFQ